MSRAEKVRVNTKMILNQLKKLDLTQQELAESIGMNYIGVHRAIHAGEMTERMMLAIGEKIGIAPESMQGIAPFSDDDEPLPWEYHLFHGASLKLATEELMKAVSINPKNLTREQFRSISSRFLRLAKEIESELERLPFEEIQ